MKTPLFELTNVSKRYGTRTVLDIAHLAVMPGEIFAIIGPSGAGKSTLLRLLNFLESPDTGELRYDGVPIPASTGPSLEIRRQVTMVFQRPVLLSRSVAENVAYGLRVRGGRNDHALVKNALDEMGLSHLINAPARSLSGGEAQRVALARALIFQPKALLLDEPTANLDPANITLIERRIRAENERRGTTVVLVTHNIFQARRLAHRTGLLLDGRLVEVAPTSQFFNQPSDPRTSAFIAGEIPY